MDSLAATHGPSAVKWQDIIRGTLARDSAIRALLGDQHQVDRYTRNAASLQPLPPQPVIAWLADNYARYIYLRDVPASEAEITAVTALLERSLTDEVALFRRMPDDSAARTMLFERRRSDVRRALQSEAARGAFDRQPPAFRAAAERW